MTPHHEGSASDHDLIARVRAGDVVAFELLFRMHAATMLRFALSFVADPDAAEDILQEVFGQIWMQRARWAPSTDVLSYLLAAVRNRALNVVTTSARRTNILQQHAPDEIAAMTPETFADRDVESNEQRTMLWNLIRALPEQRRTVLLLRWRHGLDWSQIAQMMGISDAAARKAHSRALQSLREQLPADLE